MARFRREHSSRRYLKLVLRVYAVVGFVAALGGLGYLLLQMASTHSQWLAMLVGLGGAALALASSLVERLLDGRREARTTDIAEELATMTLLRHWQKFELTATEVLLDRGLEGETESPGRVLAALENEGFLHPREVDILQELAWARNALAHGTVRGGDVSVAPELLEYADLVTERLRQGAGSC